MACILVTGSTQGLGLGAARALIAAGHEVVLHARSPARAAAEAGALAGAQAIVTGDLSRLDEVRAVAASLGARQPLDAVIHNAGVYEQQRSVTAEGHTVTLAVNVLAPFMLTALLPRPARLVFIGSGMHRGARCQLDDLAWTRRPWSAAAAYSESKLLLTAFACWLARRWPQVGCHVVDPGWVPTRMGGPHAPDDLVAGCDTQAWLAAGAGQDGGQRSGYWFHRRRQEPDPKCLDEPFQESVARLLSEVTGLSMT